MASKIPNCIFVCVILLVVVQNSAAKTLVPKCDYGCKEQSDLNTGDDYFASGSAISSQFVMPDGSVLTNSKETAISSDGIKHTFHELKKEADRFVQTGQSGPAIHSHLPSPFGVPNAAIPQLPKLTVPVPFYPSSHQALNNQFGQSQNSMHVQHSSNSAYPCDPCAVINAAGSGNSEQTASYNTIVGNVPVNEGHSSYQKYESSAQKNSSSTYQTQPQPVPFALAPKPNTFTTTFLDLNGANRRQGLQNGAGESESHVTYQEQGSSQVKSQERVIPQPAYGGGPIAYPQKVVVGVNGPAAVNSYSHEKQESSSHVQTSNNGAVLPVVGLAQQAEAELNKQYHHNNALRSPILLGGVPQAVPLDQHSAGGAYQSSHSYYSSSSSKSVSSSDDGGPVIVHQSPPQKYSASSGYSSSSSSSSGSSSNGAYSQVAPEVYYGGNRVHGVSSSIYDQQLRGDQLNANAETLCSPPCTYVSAGAPVKKTYGVATSYSSQSSTINGKTTENREAAVAVNDNGKVDSYHVKT